MKQFVGLAPNLDRTVLFRIQACSAMLVALDKDPHSEQTQIREYVVEDPG